MERARMGNEDTPRESEMKKKKEESLLFVQQWVRGIMSFNDFIKQMDSEWERSE